jgi:hypothetical protein
LMNQFITVQQILAPNSVYTMLIITKYSRYILSRKQRCGTKYKLQYSQFYRLKKFSICQFITPVQYMPIPVQ